MNLFLEEIMKKIAIITDSAGDLSASFAKKHNIKVIPLRICFSDREFLDGVNIRSSEIYQFMDKEIPKSSLPYRNDIISTFEQVKSEGYTDVIYIGISSGLSGTFNSVRLIANEFDGLNIHCFDSKALSCAQNMLISTAVTALKTTDNVQEILNKLQKTRKKMVAMFCVRDLTYLIKGGRIGKVAGTVGTLLKLCPVIKVNDDGVYETASKTIGFNRAIDTLINEFKTHFANAEIAISLTYSSNKEIAEKIKSEIKKHCNVKSCEMNPVTAVLGVHTGPDMAGIAAYQI